MAPELIPIDADRRSETWRSALAGKRALVLLDNAVDAGQVRPLLPGTSGVVVIITSRRRLTALEAHLNRQQAKVETVRRQVEASVVAQYQGQAL